MIARSIDLAMLVSQTIGIPSLVSWITKQVCIFGANASLHGQVSLAARGVASLASAARGSAVAPAAAAPSAAAT